jgi:crotonobetainyl-CoA:carnitine CoA-transferase CaiB-like acyl-CoA transferase
VENREDITARLAAIFEKRATKDWCDALEAAGVPNGPINDLKQVFEEPQVVARGMKIELDHATGGKVPLIASPMKFSGTPLEFKQPPPVLGQHTDEVLRGVLNLKDADIAKLRADGIV